MTDTGKPQLFCTECGTALHGAKFCPECGVVTANAPASATRLVAGASGSAGGTAIIAPPAAEAVTRRPAPAAATRAGHGGNENPPGEMPPAGAQHSRRRLTVGLVAAFVAAGLAVGIALMIGGGGSSAQHTTTVTVPRSSSTTPATPSSASAISKGAAAALAYEYAAAYSAKSVPALGALLAPGFYRKNDGEPVQDKTHALATYQGQFAHLSEPQYRLSGLLITPGRGAAKVSADYRITSAAGTVTGVVVFNMAHVNGKLMITSLGAAPNNEAPPSGSGTSGGGTSGGGTSGGGTSGGGTSGGSTSGGSTSGGSTSGGSSSGGSSGGLLWYGPSLPPSYVPDLG